MSTDGRTKQFRRETDHTPRVPPAGAAGKRRNRNVVDLISAVKQNVRHFQIGSTRRELYDRWLMDVQETQLMSDFRDPRGGPRRVEVEAALRLVAREEHKRGVVLSIENAQLKQEVRKLEFQLAIERHVFRKVA